MMRQIGRAEFQTEINDLYGKMSSVIGMGKVTQLFWTAFFENLSFFSLGFTPVIQSSRMTGCDSTELSSAFRRSSLSLSLYLSLSTPLSLSALPENYELGKHCCFFPYMCVYAYVYVYI